MNKKKQTTETNGCHRLFLFSELKWNGKGVKHSSKSLCSDWRAGWQMNTATREKTGGKAEPDMIRFIHNPLIYISLLTVISLLFPMVVV